MCTPSSHVVASGQADFLLLSLQQQVASDELLWHSLPEIETLRFAWVA